MRSAAAQITPFMRGKAPPVSSLVLKNNARLPDWIVSPRHTSLDFGAILRLARLMAPPAHLGSASTGVFELMHVRFPSKRLRYDRLQFIELWSPAKAHADLVGGGNDSRWVAGAARRIPHFEISA